MLAFVMLLILILTSYLVWDVVQDWRHPFPLKELEDSPASRVSIRFLPPVWADDNTAPKAVSLPLLVPYWVNSTYEYVENQVLNNLQHMQEYSKALESLPRPRLSRMPLWHQYVYGLMEVPTISGRVHQNGAIAPR